MICFIIHSLKESVWKVLTLYKVLILFQKHKIELKELGRNHFFCLISDLPFFLGQDRSYLKEKKYDTFDFFLLVHTGLKHKIVCALSNLNKFFFVFLK